MTIIFHFSFRLFSFFPVMVAPLQFTNIDYVETFRIFVVSTFLVIFRQCICTMVSTMNKQRKSNKSKRLSLFTFHYCSQNTITNIMKGICRLCDTNNILGNMSANLKSSPQNQKKKKYRISFNQILIMSERKKYHSIRRSAFQPKKWNLIKATIQINMLWLVLNARF